MRNGKNRGQFSSHNMIVYQIELVDVTVLRFLFQHDDVDTTLVDNGAISVTEQKAFEVLPSKHLHDQIPQPINNPNSTIEHFLQS